MNKKGVSIELIWVMIQQKRVVFEQNWVMI